MKKPAQEVRQHILDVAKSLMTFKGYTAVGLAEVVAAAGVPKGSFYYYFKSKEDFGRVLLEDYFGAYLLQVDAMLTADGTGLERLQKYFLFWEEKQCTGLTDGKCLVIKLGPEVCDLSEDMRCVLRLGTDAIVARIALCIEGGQKDQSIASTAEPSVLAGALYQLWLGASVLDKLAKDGKAFKTALIAMDHLLA